MTTRTSQFKLNKASENPQNGLSSAPIAWTVVNDMQQEYADNPDAMKIQTPTGIQVLKGVRFEAQQIKNLLEGKNESGVVVQSPAEHLYIMFGVRPHDIGKPAGEQFFTLVASGIDGQNNLLKDVLIDYAAPCPHDCPNI
jgi:hypothetical protein